MNTELQQYITDYDNHKVMEAVEMGGLGNGYEIAIQELAIETMRVLQITEVPKEDDDAFIGALNIASNEACSKLDGGFTGAQAGASKNIAAIFWKQTPEKALQMMKDKDPERIIKIMKAENDKLILVS